MLVANLDSNDYRRAHRHRPHLQRPREGRRAGHRLQVGRQARATKVTKLYTFDGLKRVDTQEAAAGDIDVAGIEDITIGETIASPENPKAIPPIAIDEPTVSMIFGVNTSPLSGREASASRRVRSGPSRRGTARQRVDSRGTDRFARADAHHRTRRTAAVHPHRDDAPRRLRDSGLAPTSSPKSIDGVDGADGTARDRRAGDHQGVVIAERRRTPWRMSTWSTTAAAACARFRIPARGLIGFRSQFMTDTKGTGIMNHIFDSWEPWHGIIPARATGALGPNRAGVATSYALYNIQERGEIFIDPATQLYEA